MTRRSASRNAPARERVGLVDAPAFGDSDRTSIDVIAAGIDVIAQRWGAR